jgi:flagellar biogenesis protein FliO
MGLGLRGISMSLIWTRLVLGLLKFLALVICLFFLLKMIHIVPKVMGVQLMDHRVQVSGSCGRI